MNKDVYIRALEREKLARKEAERILEEKALELFETNKKLNKLFDKKSKELGQTEEKYRNIFNSAFDAIVVISKDGCISECNKKFLEIIGYDYDEVDNLSIETLIHSQDKNKYKKFNRHLLDKGFYSDYRGRIMTKDKSTVNIEINSIAIYENGKFNGSIDIIRDITDRIEIEKMLFDSGERYRAIFNNTPLGVIINSFQGKYIDINNRALEIFQCDSKEELFKSDLNKLFHTPDVDKVINSIKRLRKGITKIENLEVAINTLKGKRRYLKITATSIENLNSGSKQFISLIEDITEWKNSQKLVIENEEKWRFVIENMKLGLVEVDINGIIVKTYDRFCEMTGYQSSELIGKSAHDFLIKDKESLKIFHENWENRKKGENTAYELQLTKKNGHKCWVLVSGSSLKDKSNKMIGSLGIHMDITPRKLMLEDLKRAKLEAEESSKAKENFLANMSHEIRTPMNAIMGITRLLKETKSKNDKQKYLNAIESSAENLLVIINDILDISKIEANKLDIGETSFSLRKTINQLQTLLSYKAEEKGILLKIEVHDEVHDKIYGDPVRLSQMLTNLINNAIKFTERGIVTCSINLVHSSHESQILNFKVSDTGIGISEDKLKNIFESFTQEDQTTSRKYGGTGLGLAITKKLVELHGGEINVLSKKGEGTTFSFSLDYKKDLTKNLTKEEKFILKEESLVLAEGLNVLLVEDHEINKLLAETILTNWKMNVTHAENGKIALGLIKENNYDIVLMDVQMPVMDGLEATRRIRNELKSNLPIIALTANAIKGDDIKCFEAGMNDYVSKPIEPSTLFNKILNLVNNNGK